MASKKDKKPPQGKKNQEQPKEQQTAKEEISGGSGVCRKFLTILLLILCGAVLTEPYYRPSKPRNDLCIFKAANKVGEMSLWVDNKLEQNIPPPYYTLVKDFARPYGILAKDVLKSCILVQENTRAVIASYVKEQYPIVVASIDAYAPGLLDNTQVIVSKAFDKTIYYYHSGVNYLQREVFIGQLSPENIQRVVVQAYNTTSEKAIEYYHWVYEKVQTSIK